MKKSLTASVFIAAIGGLVFAVLQLAHSPIFIIQKIEIIGLEKKSLTRLPISEQKLRSMLGIREGVSQLFQVDLAELKDRLMSQIWLKRADLRKKIPNGIEVEIEFRNPVAFFQSIEGDLKYVDADGALFGPVDYTIAHNLPVMTGFDPASPGFQRSFEDALSLLGDWNKHMKSGKSQISAIHSDPNGRLKILFTYPITSGQRARSLVSRTVVPWQAQSVGQNLDTVKGLARLSKIVEYLQQRSLPAHTILIGDGKKIVVKTSHGS